MADLIVAGGGPAGLATAIFAARAGLRAQVFDRRPPRAQESNPTHLDKACGEGLMPAGLVELRRMGVEIPPWGRHPFVGVRYVRGKRQAEGRFRHGTGMGVRRTALMAGLLGRARELGVDLHYGHGVNTWRSEGQSVVVGTTLGECSARLLVGADGLHSRLRKQQGLEVPSRVAHRGRFGVRMHFDVEPWDDWVEVHWGRRAEAYVTPVGPRLVGVAILWNGMIRLLRQNIRYI